jgi:hypothetical protein
MNSIAINICPLEVSTARAAESSLIDLNMPNISIVV